MSDKPKRRSSQQYSVDWYNELLRNDIFRRELKVIRSVSDLNERMEMAAALANRYSLDFTIESPLHKWIWFVQEELPNKLESTEDLTDLFRVNNDFALEVIKEYGRKNYDLKVEKTSALVASQKFTHPVSISIRRGASKTEMLEFIEARWDELVEPVLKDIDRKPSRIGVRRRQKEDDFLWEHQNVSHGELAKLFVTTFPDTNPLFNAQDVDKRLSRIRKRRGRPLH